MDGSGWRLRDAIGWSRGGRDESRWSTLARRRCSTPGGRASLAKGPTGHMGTPLTGW
jgi:hypothetical protein